MQISQGNYKRPSPEVWAEHPEDCFQIWGPNAPTVILGWFKPPLTSNLVSKKCAGKMPTLVLTDPSRPFYSMASWHGEKIRVQLAQAMPGVTYPDT